MSPSKRKPHNNLAGYRSERRNPYSGGYTVIYDAAEAHLDISGGRWVVSCETHNTLCNTTSLKRAYEMMRDTDFCEKCMAIRG